MAYQANDPFAAGQECRHLVARILLATSASGGVVLPARCKISVMP
ncbi:hypothetical protein PENANT_c083G01710 [Penicillium antarcticum]|uniref:Uncharacterized protein n=1 Tax=Penicillium antarcticum TaxID=416450 RepID=A0A1V6PP57_9EURO|nr:hypothetical protein PENANT_c083G01710 [Penicillium antarcticum]